MLGLIIIILIGIWIARRLTWSARYGGWRDDFFRPHWFGWRGWDDRPPHDMGPGPERGPHDRGRGPGDRGPRW